ncbi:MAG: GGDEF domain-containing protein, partial [Lachnospiraceae bacterium]|nr:GGDEF domain-containing protein [Lachnospiraceae bacterium]
GDRVLVEFASIFRYNVRKEDVISRIGGDEFLAFFPQMTHREEVAAFTHRLNEQLTEKAEQLMGKGHGIPLGISVGVSFVPSGTDNFRILFQYADSALYEVKRNGKHGYRIYDPEISVENVEDDPEKELHNIIQIISERGEIRGGMLLGQEAFSWNYRFIQRFMTRFDGEAARVLFSLSSDEKGVIYTEMVSEFGNVLKDNLRKTDIILQWRQNRYFAVLPLLAENDISRLVGRVMKAWSRTPYGERLKVSYVTSMLRKERHEREK